MKVNISGTGRFGLGITVESNFGAVSPRLTMFYKVLLPTGDSKPVTKEIPLSNEIWADKADIIASATGRPYVEPAMTISADGQDFHINPVLQVKAQSQLTCDVPVEQDDVLYSGQNYLEPVGERGHYSVLRPGDNRCYLEYTSDNTRAYIVTVEQIDGCVVASRFYRDGRGEQPLRVECNILKLTDNNTKLWSQFYSRILTTMYPSTAQSRLSSPQAAYAYCNELFSPYKRSYLEQFERQHSESKFNQIWRTISGSSIDENKIRAIVDPLCAGVIPALNDRLGLLNSNSLSHAAMQDIGLYDGDGLAYLKDIADIKSSVTSFAETLATIPKTKVKGMAQTYLSSHYGWKLQYLDTREILEKNILSDGAYRLRRLSASHTHSVGKTAHTARLHIYYRDKIVVEDWLTRILRKYDLNPDLDNIWDMVPYSFVVDWFVDMGSVFTAVSNMYKVQSAYSTAGCCRSDKVVTDYDSDDLGIPGMSVRVTGYCRVPSRSVPTPLPSVEQLLIPSSPLNHWLEGASLIVAR